MDKQADSSIPPKIFIFQAYLNSSLQKGYVVFCNRKCDHFCSNVTFCAPSVGKFEKKKNVGKRNYKQMLHFQTQDLHTFEKLHLS